MRFVREQQRSVFYLEGPLWVAAHGDQLHDPDELGLAHPPLVWLGRRAHGDRHIARQRVLDAHHVPRGLPDGRLDLDGFEDLRGGGSDPQGVVHVLARLRVGEGDDALGGALHVRDEAHGELLGAVGAHLHHVGNYHEGRGGGLVGQLDGDVEPLRHTWGREEEGRRGEAREGR